MKIAPMLLPVLATLASGAASAQQAPPAPPALEFVLEERVTMGTDLTPGETPYGRRNFMPVTGGSFEGPGLKGTILPGGDWQLVRPDGCVDINATYMLRTDDGVLINVVNRGVACAPFDAMRTTPVFEAPRGKYEWLGKGVFVGTVEPANTPDGGSAVRIRFFRVR